MKNQSTLPLIVLGCQSAHTVSPVIVLGGQSARQSARQRAHTSDGKVPGKVPTRLRESEGGSEGSLRTSKFVCLLIIYQHHQYRL